MNSQALILLCLLSSCLSLPTPGENVIELSVEGVDEASMNLKTFNTNGYNSYSSNYVSYPTFSSNYGSYPSSNYVSYPTYTSNNSRNSCLDRYISGCLWRLCGPGCREKNGNCPGTWTRL